MQMIDLVLYNLANFSEIIMLNKFLILERNRH